MDNTAASKRHRRVIGMPVLGMLGTEERPRTLARQHIGQEIERYRAEEGSAVR